MTNLTAGTKVRVRLNGGQDITANFENILRPQGPGRIAPEATIDLINCSDGIDHWCHEYQIIG